MTEQVQGPLQIVRLRVFAVLVAGILAAVGLISLAAWPVWSAVGVTLAAVAFAVNAVTSPLAKPVCWSCGHNLDGVATHTYGVTCPGCGSIHGGIRVSEASEDFDPAADFEHPESGEPIAWADLPEPGATNQAQSKAQHESDTTTDTRSTRA